MTQIFNVDIEVLEPLVLMSASCMDIAPQECQIQEDCGELLSAFSNDLVPQCGVGVTLGGSHHFGWGDDRSNNADSNCHDVTSAADNGGSLKAEDHETYVCRSGNRADFSVDSHGFGIYSLKSHHGFDLICGVREIQFNDGKYAIADLISCDGVAENAISPETPELDEMPIDSNEGEDLVVYELVDEFVEFDGEQAESGDNGGYVDHQVSADPYYDDLDDFEDEGSDEEVIPVFDGNAVNLPAGVQATVTFESEGAGYQNTVGAYDVDPATGTISNVRILFANASQVGSGGSLIGGESAVSISGTAGQSVGFFILANGNQLNDIGAIENSALSLVPANEGGLRLMAHQPNGQSVALTGPVYVSGNPSLNPDGMDHFRFSMDGESLRIAIEDLPSLGDHDFDDVVLSLTSGPIVTPEPEVPYIISEPVGESVDVSSPVETDLDDVDDTFVGDPVSDDGPESVDEIWIGDESTDPSPVDDGAAEEPELLVDSDVNNADAGQANEYRLYQGGDLYATVGSSDVAGDSSNDGYSYAIKTEPAKGSLNFYPNGTFDYHGPSDFQGDVSFEYIRTDANGNSSSGMVVIRINGISPSFPDVDVAPIDEVVVDEVVVDEVVVDEVVVDEVVVDEVVVDEVVVDEVVVDEVVVDEVVVDEVVVDEVVADEAPVNEASVDEPVILPFPSSGPSASPDEYTIHIAGDLYGNVGDNDSDSDGDKSDLVYSLKTEPSTGSLNFYGDGSFDYHAFPGFEGDVSFSYEVNNANGGTSESTVVIHIAGVSLVEEPPVEEPPVEEPPVEEPPVAEPPVDPVAPVLITAAVVGDDQICEGDAATYKIQLDQAVSVDTWFTVQVTDGTANRVDRNDYEAAHQDIMWGGYYDYRYGIGGPLASIVDNRISNGTYSGTDRPTVGPDGAAIWDYTVQKGGAVQSGGTVQVLVRAGQSMSESFEIQTWNERVTVDNDSDFTRQNGGYREYTETFSMAITQASSCDSIQVESSARTISILDKTQYESFSPIALDLNGDGRIGVTGESTVKDADRNAIGRTVSFDIDADGKLDQIEWFSGDGDGILVNTAYIGANGEIDGSALFGDEGGKYANGYEKLSALDANGDGVLSDLEMAELALWLDDGDAVLEERELHSLREFNVSSLLVGMNLDDEGRMRSIAQLTDGSQILTEDVWFAGL